MTQRERIVEQTMQMFVTQGIKSVRMDDIAQQLGISKRTLYEQFGDKEGLLYEAMVCFFEQKRCRMEQQSAGAADVLEAMFWALRDVMDTAAVTHRMVDNLQKFYPAVYEKLMREGTERNRQEFRKMLDTGIADGLFIDDINIELAISVLYYTASALVLRRELMLPDGVTEQQAFMQMITTFFRGISTAKGLALIDEYKRREAVATDSNDANGQL